MAYSKIDPEKIPANYTEFFRDYYPYTIQLVAKYGIDSRKTGDVASEIIGTFFRRDFLPKYNPNFEVEYKGRKRNVQFASFYINFVMTYLKGIRDKQHRLARRELMICDAPWAGDQTFVESCSRPVVVEFGAGAEEALLVRRVRDYLDWVPPTSLNDRCDLPVVFDWVVRQVRESGMVSVPDMAKEFGISSSAGYNWFARLKTHVQEALDYWDWQRA